MRLLGSGSTAALALTLSGPTELTVTVYDLLGRTVATVLAGTLNAGVHRAAVDVPALAPGVYVVGASVNSASGPVVKTARLTVIR